MTSLLAQEIVGNNLERSYTVLINKVFRASADPSVGGEKWGLETNSIRLSPERKRDREKKGEGGNKEGEERKIRRKRKAVM